MVQVRLLRPMEGTPDIQVCDIAYLPGVPRPGDIVVMNEDGYRVTEVRWHWATHEREGSAYIYLEPKEG